MMLAANLSPFTQQASMKDEEPEDTHHETMSPNGSNCSVATSSEPSTPTVSTAPISNGPSSSGSLDTPSTNVSSADLMGITQFLNSPIRSQPLDLSAVFASPINTAAFQDAEKNSGSLLDTNLFATALGTAPQFGLNIPYADGTALLQLFAAQHQQQLQQQIQQQQQMQQDHQQKEKQEQHRQAQQQQPVRLQSQLQSPGENASNDKKRSYPYTFQFCVLCQKNVHSSKLPCHIRQCHVGKPMFQCPACDFTSTYSKNNVKSHMVSLHGLAGDPISFMDQYAGQVEEYMKKCFPNVRGRGRPVHAGRVSPRSPTTPTAVKNFNGALQNQLSTFRPNQSYRRQRGQRGMNDVYTNMMLLANKSMGNLQQSNFNFYLPCLNNTPNNNNNNNNGASNGPYAGIASMMTPTHSIKMDDPIMNVVTPTKTNDVKSMEQLFKDFGKTGSSDSLLKFTSTSNSNSSANSEPRRDIASSLGASASDEENIEPRYLPQTLKWDVLESDRLPNTVFKTFTNPSEVIEKFDSLIKFETLNSNAFLTSAQLEKIAEVRKRVNLKTFEIMFAVYRCDFTVLPAEHVDLIVSIAPTEVDIRRFKIYEQSNSTSALSEDERFILELSKIERLKERLCVMSFLGSFEDKVQLINQQLNDLSTAAKTLHNSPEFHTILQLLLTCGNFINGDFNSQLVEGFKTSSIVDMCNFQFPNGTTLLDVLAERIQDKFPELKQFHELLKLSEASSKVEFLSILQHIRKLERGQERLEAEVKIVDSNSVLVEGLNMVELELAQLKETLQISKEQLILTLEFFGETVHSDEANFEPENFFKTVFDFLKNLQRSLSQF